MREKRLLDRIRSQAKSPSSRVSQDPKNVMRSIRRHLQRILNTRRGNVPIADDYGIPDFTDFLINYPGSLQGFQRGIRDTIQKYEPRLKSVRVNFIPQDEDPLSLRFQVIAKLATEDHKDPVLFESVVGSDGKISIRG